MAKDVPTELVDRDGQVTLQLNVTVAKEHYHVLREYLERTAEEDTRLGLVEFCRRRQIPIVVAWVSAIGDGHEAVI
jgi:hypothetical protein